jgi:threonine dehydratase
MTGSTLDPAGPSLDAIRAAAASLAGRIVATPIVELPHDRLKPFLPEGARAVMKLELFQHAGSFKARGALLNIDALDVEARGRGVTGVTAGNHGLALAWAARAGGVSAKIVMPQSADPMRVAGCRAMGADVVLVADVHAAFAEMERIVREEGRSVVHPFEGARVTLGTATCGLEFIEAARDLDAMIIPVGGGGLISGIARAVKLVAPHCRVYGVEPEGADSLSRSFASGRPEKLDKVATIADSLGAPMALAYSFGVARANVDRLVTISDEAMLKAMTLLYDALKIAPEPACAAATAAAMGPLRAELAGKRIGLIACGSNIGETKFADFCARGRALLED